MDGELQRFADIEENLKEVRCNIEEAAIRSGRTPGDVTLMAVTKTVDVAYVNHAIRQGIAVIGENKVQEVLSKTPALRMENCSMHLIGHLQSNKVKKIVGAVDMIESADSIEIAQEIAKRSLQAGIVTKILMEINVGNEESKFGFSLAEAEERAHQLAEIQGISLQGMMCVAPICEKEADLRNVFSNMYRSYLDIKSKKINNIEMNILSMGMSGDYREAIAEGANLVRVGSAIFGARNYR